MKKFFILFVAGGLYLAACSNSNTVNVPKADSNSNNVTTPVPHDTASNMRDSAKNPDSSIRYK